MALAFNTLQIIDDINDNGVMRFINQQKLKEIILKIESDSECEQYAKILGFGN